MHVVLGLVFLKHISDALRECRDEFTRALFDPANDYYLGDDSGTVDSEMVEHELGARDDHTEKNVFRVPALAHWSALGLRTGSQPHHAAAGLDEHGHSR